MFDFVRNNSRIFLGVLVGLIALSFFGGGLQGYESFVSNDTVAQVAGRKISQTEWDNAHRQMVENMRVQAPDVDAKLLDSPEMKKRALDSLLKDYTLLAALRDQRLSVPDSRLKRIFAVSPEFEQVRNPDGSLNTKLLEARGMSAVAFAARVRDQIAVSQVLGGVERTALASKTSNRQAIEAFFQTREVQWMKFEPKNYVADLNPSVAQLQTFFAAPDVGALFQQPERADVQYVVLDLEALKQKITVSEADLRKSYQDNIKRYTKEEERRASHILISADKSLPAAQRQAAKAKAEQLLAQAKANPAQFGALAHQHSQDPGSAANNGDLDFFSKGAMVKPFEDAAFALQKGQISGVVETDYGYHIIMLTDVRGGGAQPFEQVRAQLEDDARKQLALSQYADAAEQFTNTVYEQADSLQPVATALKLTVQSAVQVLRQPGVKDQGVLANKRLLEALFDATNRSKARNTEAIEVGPNQLVSARIVKYYPSAKPAFEPVQAQVRERWVQRESTRLARKDAQDKMALWQKNPAQAQLPVAVGMSRRSVFSQPPQVMDAVLRVPEAQLPAWRVVDIDKEGFALVKINKVLPLVVNPEEESGTRVELSRYLGKAEADAYLKALQRNYKLDIKDAAAKLTLPAEKTASVE
jgi:peptidyl-prolyl cis-trans isomerase D